MKYYHVGYVVSVDPLDIIHCTRSQIVDGITHDHKIGRWSHRAWSKFISSEQRGNAPVGLEVSTECAEASTDQTTAGMEGIYHIATVVSDNGEPVKMRAKPSRRCRLYWLVPSGASILAADDRSDGWTPVRRDGRQGYMMTKFLSRG